VWERIRSLLFGARDEQETDEELRFHLEMATAKNIEVAPFWRRGPRSPPSVWPWVWRRASPWAGGSRVNCTDSAQGTRSPSCRSCWGWVWCHSPRSTCRPTELPAWAPRPRCAAT